MLNTNGYYAVNEAPDEDMDVTEYFEPICINEEEKIEMEENVNTITVDKKADIDKIVNIFKDNGWRWTGIGMINGKELKLGRKNVAASFFYDKEKPYLVLRSTVDGDASTYVTLSQHEVYMFNEMLGLTFQSLASLFIRMDEV